MSRILIGLFVIATVAVFAGTRPDGSPTPVHAATQTFLQTGAMQQYPVPAGVTQVRIEARAAGGAAGCNGAAPATVGGNIAAIVPVTGGTTLFVFVGGNGGTPTASAGGSGGFNGGGTGGTSTGTVAFHGGGG